MGNLVSPSADEPDNRRAPTSTAELPMERDNDAAPALGARPNQEREPAARHISTGMGDRRQVRFLGVILYYDRSAQQMRTLYFYPVVSSFFYHFFLT